MSRAEWLFLGEVVVIHMTSFPELQAGLAAGNKVVWCSTPLIVCTSMDTTCRSNGSLNATRAESHLRETRSRTTNPRQRTSHWRLTKDVCIRVNLAGKAPFQKIGSAVPFRQARGLAKKLSPYRRKKSL